MIKEINIKKLKGKKVKLIKWCPKKSDLIDVDNKNKKKSTKLKLNKRLFFLLKFFLIFSTLELIIINLNLEFLTKFLTLITATITNLPFHFNQINMNGQLFIITNSCTGLTTIAMFFALIFAFNYPKLEEKIKLFLIGGLILVIINIFRIIFILKYVKLGFDGELIHSLTWLVMSLVCIIIWYKLNKENLLEFNKEL
ncbi:MAG: hypothetical protein PHQ98_03795 [Candidatus ainarchaeum sp.]|nr:hypothetical protein [Candidatus ainarchaeum sp.]